MKVVKHIFIVLFALLLSCENSLDPSNTLEWQLQHKFQDGITYYAIDFPDQKNGWAVGYSGTIQKTSDSGNSWSKQKCTVVSNLWDVCFIDKNTGWICGADNTILKTIDGGKNWINISPQNKSDKIITSIKFVDKINGWATSNQGELLKSNDGGISWSVVKLFNRGGSKLSVFDKNTIYCLNGDLFRTFDGGETWDSQKPIKYKNYAYADMYFTNPSSGYLTTINGTGGSIITEFPILSTNDSGETWQESDLLKEVGLNCVFFVNDKYGWIAGIENIYKTIDGGQTWELDYSSKEKPIWSKDICFVNKSSGWIINYDGEVFKY